MNLPPYIFFTGVPGSRWSGIAQALETIPGFNTSDRTPEREYSHGTFSGHKGAYFGREMEFLAIPSLYAINQAWTERGGTKLVKSHDWAYYLDEVKKIDDTWIMLVYRPDMVSYAWWHEAGGFQIKYPCYSWYKNSSRMLGEITIQNQKILEFAHKHDATWNYFTADWIYKNFSHKINLEREYADILVTIIK
jgi:hypothetical protein